MSVRGEVRHIPGVQAIDVSAATGKVVVTSQTAVDDTTVIAVVDEAGYKAVRLA